MAGRLRVSIRLPLGAACLSAAVLAAACAPPAGSDTPLQNGQWVRILRVSTDASSMVVVDPGNPAGRPRLLATVVGPVRDAVKLAAPGDLVRVELSGDLTQLSGVTPVTVPVDDATRGAALVLAALAVVIPAWFVFRRRLRWVLVGEDNRYSVSKFQMALWTVAVLASYLATIALRWRHGGPAFIGGVEVPANVLWISGLSVLGFAGAKQIVLSRIASVPTAARYVAKTESPEGSRFPRDLLTDDTGQRPDIGDIQMMLVSLIAAATYLVQVFGWLQILNLSANVTMPDIGGTMLGLFGAGQAAYLGKKLAGDTGATAAPGPLSTDLPPKPPI